MTAPKRHFIHASIATLHAIAEREGIKQTLQQCFDRHMASPLATYMGGGWFSLTTRVDPGDKTPVDSPRPAGECGST